MNVLGTINVSRLMRLWDVDFYSRLYPKRRGYRINDVPAGDLSG